MFLDTASVLRALASGNFHQPGALRIWHLGTVDLSSGRLDDPKVFGLLDDVKVLMEVFTPSVVKRYGHVTGWTEPTGDASPLQWSLYNTSGQTDDTSSDFSYGVRKEPVPGLPGIARLIKSLPGLVNMRLNVLPPEVALSPHEEHLPIWWDNSRVALRARFHLPVITNPKAIMSADGDMAHMRAGHVYAFNNGCVHYARNDGYDNRAHLVWDQIMTQEALDTMFGSTPPVWLEQSVYPVRILGVVGETEGIPSEGLSWEEFSRRELIPHPGYLE